MGVSFVGIPFYTLAKYRRMGDAVKSLRRAGIVHRIKLADSELIDLGDIDCPSIKRDHGPENLRNFEEFVEGTRRVRDKLAEQATSSRITFCLGGDCAFVPGSLAGLKTVYKGKPGMVWLDAHGDFNIPDTSPSGFIGGMPLAIACGKGPRLTADIESQRPLLDEKNVIHVGSRSLDPGEDELLGGSVKLFPAAELKKRGAQEAALQIARFLGGSCDWVIAHLDVDVLDPSVMPGVDFPEQGGLSSQDILEIFHALHSTDKLKVVDLTAFNPGLDKGNRGRSLLLDLAPKLVSRYEPTSL
ncbi:MAG TPA: arginase family protein [Candidatus Bathyarchaeia archaeon]|nr:arginase family protein [Candidatus Bathyarchaeia archaeon]